jgi:hypothetical protein
VEFVVKDWRGVYERGIRKLSEILLDLSSETPPMRLIREKNRSSPIQSGTPAVAEFIMTHTGLEQPHYGKS